MSAQPEYASTPDPSFTAYGARALGMGGAYVGVADDASAVFMNPAGLGQLKSWEITSMSTQILEKVDYKLIGGAMKFGPGTLGIGYIGTSAPAGSRRDGEGNLLSASTITLDSHLGILSYGINMSEMMDSSDDMGDMLVGANVKYMMKSFNGLDGEAVGTGVNADIGLMFMPKDRSYTFGVAMQNLMQDGSLSWTSGTLERAEGRTRVGGTIKLLDSSLLLAADADVSSGLGAPTLFHVGAEWKPIDLITIRAGIDQSSLSKTETANNLTAGVGLNLVGFRFDYAYRADDAIESNKTHYFSITYRPEEEKKARKLEGKEGLDGEEVKEEREGREVKKEVKENRKEYSFDEIFSTL